MSTLTHADIAADAQAPRSRMLWVLCGAIAAGQLFAFWLLCSHQVRKAEARRNEVVVQQMALSDCLQYIPGSTIASCSARNDMGAQPTHASGKSMMTGSFPVSFTLR